MHICNPDKVKAQAAETPAPTQPAPPPTPQRNGTARRAALPPSPTCTKSKSLVRLQSPEIARTAGLQFVSIEERPLTATINRNAELTYDANRYARPLTGLLIGICGIAAFWASEHWGGGRFARGLNFTTPTAELMNTIVTGNSKPLFADTYALDLLKVTRSIFTVIGVPLGAYISAKILKNTCGKSRPRLSL